ncbi:sialic acid-binding Ig-like lectin 14 [Sphaerodactylus townsendi]|uniref:sialic acid-binding Ig-like lectin 14 n=1 Tax=Sphaerodactylus townsendi TaxID=933632 RepID=UPI0020264879|nr:sialic acid-binding Ig-like lectin 14 [Sphaerodactylus townsendi]
MDLSWKVVDLASCLATLIVLILACPCKGLQSSNLEYNLTVPASVSVQPGLCVHIPCSFTYKMTDRITLRKKLATLYGYWFQKKDGYHHHIDYNSQYIHGVLVATNDKRQTFETFVLERFQLTGQPEEGDCSFSILDARSGDAGEYFFRIEDNGFRYSYTNNPNQTPWKLNVLMTEFTEKPQIQNSTLVLSGKEAVFTCSVPGPCIKIEPSFYWRDTPTVHRTYEWSLQHSNGSWTYGSNITFTPSPREQEISLTCRVWYPNIAKQVEKTIHIDIADPPKTVLISSNATNDKNVDFCPPDSIVAKEGESILLKCNAEGRPDPTLSWIKGSKTLNSIREDKKQILLLSNIRAEDTGEYQCRAETPYGSANKTIDLCVQYGPRLSSNRSRSMCWQEDNSLHCNCSLNSWPPLQIQWEVDGQTLSENSSEEAPEVTFGSQEITSSMSWAAGNLDESHDIICRGANHLGTYTFHFLVNPFAKWNRTSSVVAGVSGFLVALILVVLFFVLFKFYKKRKAKASSKPSDVEVLNSANGGHQRANDNSLIYSNISPLGPKSPHVNQERISPSNPRVSSSNTAEPEELHYATLEFSRPKTKQATNQEEAVEYSAVRPK